MRLSPTLMAVGIWTELLACSTAMAHVTFDNLAGMTCTGGASKWTGITLRFDQEGATFLLAGQSPFRAVMDNPYKGMLTFRGAYADVWSLDKLSASVLSGYAFDVRGRAYNARFQCGK